MILTIALGCSDYGFGDPPGPAAGDTGAPTVPLGDTAPDPEPTVPDPGLRGGHFDVDTTTSYDGPTEGHFHEYDDVHDVSGVDFVAPLDTQGEVQPLSEALGDDPDLPFVVLVVNPELSPAARIVVDGEYDPADPTSFVVAGDYADTPVSSLPTYTLRSLSSLGVYFDVDAIRTGGLVGTDPTCVSRNDPGPGGAWRNGALVVQIARADQVRTDPGASAGGHGVATAGLLWEGAVFWHWPDACRTQ